MAYCLVQLGEVRQAMELLLKIEKKEPRAAYLLGQLVL
jgi:hypothetical protein